MKSAPLLICCGLLASLQTPLMAASLGTPQHVSLFMTTQDVELDDSSRIMIQNGTAQTSNPTYNVRGLFITQLYYNSCDSGNLYKNATLNNGTPEGYGIMWSSPIPIANNTSEVLGSGYLYNMISDFLNMQASQGLVSGTPGTGTTHDQTSTWCLHLGVTTASPIYVPGTLSNIIQSPVNIIVTCQDPTTVTQGTCTAGAAITQPI
jgi:hypothetical protein